MAESKWLWPVPYTTNITQYLLARMLMGDILELISAIQVYLEKRLWHQNPALSLQYILDVRMLVENPRAYLVLLKRGVVVTIQV